MKILSLSVVVPNSYCINSCKFCVSRMHCNSHPNLIEKPNSFFYNEYRKRLEFARDNGCNTVMLTGCSEPQQNKIFLRDFATMNRTLPSPFKWIELQTTGVLLDKEYLEFLTGYVGVNTISVSLASYDDVTNSVYCGMRDVNVVDIGQLCKQIKEHNCNLRLSVNLTDSFWNFEPEFFFKCAEDLGADQITLRRLYEDGSNSSQAQWVREHRLDDNTYNELIQYINKNGKVLGVLTDGRKKISINGMSTVVDDDCMSKTIKEDETYKYLILRPNCHLYSQWDDDASLIF